MENQHSAVTILDVLGVDLCARAILDHVHVSELVRSERVCRRWQRAVHNYLQTCCTLSIEREYSHFSPYTPNLETYHRTILIEDYPSLVYKTLEKWGPYFIRMIWDIQKEEDLNIIVLNCPNVQELDIQFTADCNNDILSLNMLKNFKHLRRVVLQDFYYFSKIENPDQVLGDLLQEINCESIAIIHNLDVTGSFLKYLNHSSLKSLDLVECDSLSVTDLLSVVDNLKFVTCLTLDGNNNTVIDNVHLLLTKMPQLEELALRRYYNLSKSTKDSIKSISQLVNLKRLDLNYSRDCIDDFFLEALSRGCKKLEYLNIGGSATTVSVRGLEMLCRREPAALTTLHFEYDAEDLRNGYIQFEYELMKLMQIPVYQELERLGYVELTLPWFIAATRDPRGRRLSFGIKPDVTSGGGETLPPELKLAMLP